jgi:ribosomal protein RSM22 (predicted rRNA methylase)
MQYTRETAIAYLYKKMPYHYFVYKRILSEVQKRMPHFKP